MDFRNRIVGDGEEAPDQLLANPKNWRVHTKEQREALAGVLSEVGWVQKVIVNRTTGHLVDGHLRVELALARKESSVPVVYVELSEAEEDLVLATIDPIGSLAKLDADKLGELLAKLDPETEALQKLLADLEAELGFGDGGAAEELDAEVLLDQAVQLTPGREFVVIVCDDEEDFRRVREGLGLGMVRRGGYKKGSAFDASSVARTIRAADFLEILESGR